MQNQEAINAFNLLFEYIYYLKQQIATISAENAAKDEEITAKEAEAMEFKLMYETYLNTDVEEDSALAEIIAKAKAELEQLKAA